jgi:methyltransferase (TIGR00027 family)
LTERTPTGDTTTLRNISDTALWVAWYRALESERADAWFRDPLARRLAGTRGERIAQGMAFANRNAWSYVARTVLIDRFITEKIQQGADMVVNLAAGLDTRPYRMALPSGLQWIEIDLPELLAYKAERLDGETPACILERVALDLTNVGARRDLFERLNRRATNIIVVTEGLVGYLTAEEASGLAADLARPPGFKWWTLDMMSPRLLRMLQSNIGATLDKGGAPLKFAPAEGPAFFARYGWKPTEVRSLLHAAATLKRLSFGLRLMALLPDPAGRKPEHLWGGVCLFTRDQIN